MERIIQITWSIEWQKRQLFECLKSYLLRERLIFGVDFFKFHIALKQSTATLLLQSIGKTHMSLLEVMCLLSHLCIIRWGERISRHGVRKMHENCVNFHPIKIIFHTHMLFVARALHWAWFLSSNFSLVGLFRFFSRTWIVSICLFFLSASSGWHLFYVHLPARLCHRYSMLWLLLPFISVIFLTSFIAVNR